MEMHCYVYITLISCIRNKKKKFNNHNNNNNTLIIVVTINDYDNIIDIHLQNVLTDLTEALKSNTKMDIIYLDFMKACDTVPYRRLLYEISRYGIKDPLYGRIISFFSNGCHDAL